MIIGLQLPIPMVALQEKMSTSIEYLISYLRLILYDVAVQKNTFAFNTIFTGYWIYGMIFIFY